MIHGPHKPEPRGHRVLKIPLSHVPDPSYSRSDRYTAWIVTGDGNPVIFGYVIESNRDDTCVAILDVDQGVLGRTLGIYGDRLTAIDAIVNADRRRYVLVTPTVTLDDGEVLEGKRRQVIGHAAASNAYRQYTDFYRVTEPAALHYYDHHDECGSELPVLYVLPGGTIIAPHVSPTLQPIVVYAPPVS